MPTVEPCRSCDSRIFWRDNQAGKTHCAGCFEPASRVIVACWLHVVADERSTGLDLFGDPVERVDSWKLEEIDPYSDGNADYGSEQGDDDDGSSGIIGGGYERIQGNAWQGTCTREQTDAIFWFMAKRLSGEIAITRGRNAEANGATTDKSRPPTPKETTEFYLLKNGRIVEGPWDVKKHWSAKAMTFEGAGRWYRLKKRAKPRAKKKEKLKAASQ